MKHYRNKMLYLVGVVWSVIAGYANYLQFKTKLLLKGPNMDDLMFFLGVSLAIVCFLIGGIVLFKKKSGLSWSKFMKSEIDELDEDERSIKLNDQVKKKSSSIIVSTVVLLIGYFTLFSNNASFTILQILVLSASIYTLYHLVNYFSLKHAYNNDQLPSFLDRQLIVPLVLALTIVMGFTGITHLISMDRNPTRKVSVLASTKSNNTLTFTRAVEVYRSEEDPRLIIIDKTTYQDFLWITTEREG